MLEIESLPLGPIGANCYILKDAKTGVGAVIDPGDCNAELQEKIKDVDVKYILLTHGHFDHILGAHDLKALTKAKVCIHQADADCLQDENKSLCAWEVPNAQKPMQADILLADGDTISIGESTLTVMHTPGHTKGGVCYLEKEQHILFSGDTLFCLTAGRTDFDGGSQEELLESLLKLKNLEGDYVVYPGHNRSTTLDFERTHNRFMRKL